MKTATKTTTIPKLPAGILASDLKELPWRSKNAARLDSDGNIADAKSHYSVRASFELWYVVGLDWSGWCIPTLMIAKAQYGATNPSRTYAVRVDTGTTVRIGKGPHVKACLTVHVKKTRLPKLMKFLALRSTGAERANGIRDRISSRRAEGAAHRAAGHYSWRWGTL
jgi:hypothetical protein